MERTLRQVFVENLKYYRQQKGLSQLTLAMELDKSPNYINGIENNNTFPSVETIEQIAKILEIPASKLFEEQGSPENVITFDKARFIKDITEELYARLHADIARELQIVLRKR